MLRGNARDSARERGFESIEETTGRQRKPPSIDSAIAKTKAKVFDDDVSGAEAGYWPPVVADFKSLRWLEPENASLAFLLSLVDHRLPPHFLATGLPFLPRDSNRSVALNSFCNLCSSSRPFFSFFCTVLW